jgi:hypothetical protein
VGDELGGGGVGACTVDVRAPHGGAFGAQSDGGGPPDAGRRSCDQRDLAAVPMGQVGIVERLVHGSGLLGSARGRGLLPGPHEWNRF